MTRSVVLLTVVVGVELAAGCRHGLAQTPEGLLRDGGRALEAGDFARAQQLFSALVKQSPSALNFNYLAMAEAGAGNLNQAIVHFRRSIECALPPGPCLHRAAPLQRRDIRAQVGGCKGSRALVCSIRPERGFA